MEERVAAVSAARAFVLHTVGEHRERGGVAGGGQRRSGVGQVPRTVARDSWPQVAAHSRARLPPLLPRTAGGGGGGGERAKTPPPASRHSPDSNRTIASGCAND